MEERFFRPSQKSSSFVSADAESVSWEISQEQNREIVNSLLPAQLWSSSEVKAMDELLLQASDPEI